ncbi:putative 50S ribosomal protein L27 [Zalerion maritima]|uniref:Large ribosomal subunit protein bL27m n=1 Tax=Zalerion maritima TaxID=339359 RepID=A0AAD5WQN2_9PEZI|nr:putative 50S ribosomal protein L27 [Zalerion maritima]
MALPQLQRPMWVSLSSISRLQPVYSHPIPFRSLLLQPAVVAIPEGRRYASVKSQGAYKLKPKNMHPKKYGAKRSGNQYVVPGNIIFTQKGTKWWPGENCTMGRNHSIHAAATGYVKYYRDPKVHPGRQYIGVTFNREDTLPYPSHAARKRRLNMSCIPIEPPKPELDVGEIGPSGIPERVVQQLGTKGDKSRVLKLQPNYSYREDNYALGQLLDNLKTIRKKRMRSRRLHFRMARIKRERRHMHLRANLRRDIREERERREKKLMAKLRLPRRRERAQNKTYKEALAAGKSGEEAARETEEKHGPRLNWKEGFKMQTRVMALRDDPWGGRNPGAHVKQSRRPRQSLGGTLAKASRYMDRWLRHLEVKKEQKRAKNYRKIQKWQARLAKKIAAGPLPEKKGGDGGQGGGGGGSSGSGKSGEKVKAEKKKPVKA